MIFLYFYESLPCGLDELEDALEEMLGERGEVTGVGTGKDGSNIDIEVSEDPHGMDKLINEIKETLIEMGAPKSSVVEIGGMAHRLGE